MPSMRRWVTFAVLSLGFVVGPFAQSEVPLPPPMPMPGPINVVANERLLLEQLAMHAKVLTDEISRVNERLASENPGQIVLDPRVIANMMARNPYIHALVKTSLVAIPPRAANPGWKPRSVEYMVSWRTADVFFAADDLAKTLLPDIMRALANRFEVMVPSAYFYIEAMRETYMLNPRVRVLNGELPIILSRMEAQVFVMRQLMDAIYCTPCFTPYFPVATPQMVGWGQIEATFGAYRLDVMAPGRQGIAPFPFYPEAMPNVGMIRPGVPMAPRNGATPVLNYDAQMWQGNPGQANPNIYRDVAPIGPGAGQNVPGINNPNMAPNQNIPNVSSPSYGWPNGQAGQQNGQQPGYGGQQQPYYGQQQSYFGGNQQYNGGQQQQYYGGNQQFYGNQQQDLYGQQDPYNQQQYPYGQQDPYGQSQNYQGNQQQFGPGYSDPYQQGYNQQQPNPQLQTPVRPNSSDGVTWGNFDYTKPMDAGSQQTQPQQPQQQ